MDPLDKIGNLNDLLEEENQPAIMTFRYPDSSSESESQSDEEVAEAGSGEDTKNESKIEMPKDDGKTAEAEDEDEEEVDVEAYLIKALQSKVLIKKPTRPLNEYISPNSSPKRKSPPSTPPLPANDLRWLIRAEKQRMQERKVYEQMKEARQKLYEKELERERLEKRAQFLARAKRPKKQSPKNPLAMAGICGCQGRCEWRGICRNLFKNRGTPNQAQGENQNNTF